MATLMDKLNHKSSSAALALAQALVDQFRAKYHPTYTGLIAESVDEQHHVGSFEVTPYNDGQKFTFSFAVSCEVKPHERGYYVNYDLLNKTQDCVFFQSGRISPHGKPINGQHFGESAQTATLGQTLDYIDVLTHIRGLITASTFDVNLI